MSVAKSFGVCQQLTFVHESAFAPLTLATARRFCPLGSTRQGGWRKRGRPRCSPRGTSGKKRGRRVTRPASALARSCSITCSTFTPCKGPYLRPIGTHTHV